MDFLEQMNLQNMRIKKVWCSSFGHVNCMRAHCTLHMHNCKLQRHGYVNVYVMNRPNIGTTQQCDLVDRNACIPRRHSIKMWFERSAFLASLPEANQFCLRIKINDHKLWTPSNTWINKQFTQSATDTSWRENVWGERLFSLRVS